MKRHYKAAAGAMFDDERANVYGSALERLQKKGKLTPHSIVDAARWEKSPLHVGFEWDDAVASDKYRRYQARQIMNRLVLVIEKPGAEPREVKAYFSVQEAPEEDGRERSYVHVEAVLEDQALRAQLIERAIREIETWQQRHQDLVELELIFGAIAATKEQLQNGV